MAKQQSTVETIRAKLIAQIESEQRGRADDFEMMCRRLVRLVPDCKIRQQAIDLLRRKGTASILREETTLETP
jgi:hypothetical protein